tara:strand:- start:357 stop:599 length:243 start_codon:yes stop_codon:yes gene_type:complete
MKTSKRGYHYDNKGFIHKQVVLEKYGLKEIPKGRVIHHIDGNKRNNDPDNLVLVPKRIHNKLHWCQMIVKKWNEYYLKKR